jgi:hypothetical protein
MKALALAISLLCAAFLNLVVKDFFIDDAYISFRYADNLVREGTLYYNLGEQGPFGYTNPLYVFLLAAFRLASGGTVSSEAISRGIGSLALAALLFPILSTFLERLGRRGWAWLPASGLALLVVLGFPYLLQNFYSGLETGLFTLCLFAMLVSIDPRGPRSEAVFLAALAAALGLRIDGVAIVSPLVAMYAWIALRGANRARVLRLGYAFLAAAAVYGAQFLLAGFWVPLSFYQKSSPFSVWTFWAYLTFFLVTVAPLAVLVLRRTSPYLPGLVLLYPLFVSAFYSFFMHWMFKRYVFPVAFALFSALLLALLELDFTKHRRELALVGLCALFTFPPLLFEGYSWISGYRVSLASSRAIADALAAADLPPEHRLLATQDAGYLAYRSDWRLLDLLGLTTPEVLTEDVGGVVRRLDPTVLLLNAPNRSRPEELRLRSRKGGPDEPVPPRYRFVKHLPLTNRYWWPEVDYGYFIFVSPNASPRLVEGLSGISVDVEKEMGWQSLGFRALRRLDFTGTGGGFQ